MKIMHTFHIAEENTTFPDYCSYPTRILYEWVLSYLASTWFHFLWTFVSFSSHFSSQLFSFCLLICRSSVCILGMCTMSIQVGKFVQFCDTLTILNRNLSIFFFLPIWNWRVLLSFTQVTFLSFLLTYWHCPVRSVQWICKCHVVYCDFFSFLYKILFSVALIPSLC